MRNVLQKYAYSFTFCIVISYLTRLSYAQKKKTINAYSRNDLCPKGGIAVYEALERGEQRRPTFYYFAQALLS